MYITIKTNDQFVTVAGQYKVHAVANMTPMPTSLEYLKNSIDGYGQQYDITLYKGVIIDGRCRASVCHDLGLPTKAIDLWDLNGEMEDIALMQHVQNAFARQDLLPAQRAMMAAYACATKQHKELGYTQIEYAKKICNIGKTHMDTAIYVLKHNPKYASQIYVTGLATIKKRTYGLRDTEQILRNKEYLKHNKIIPEPVEEPKPNFYLKANLLITKATEQMVAEGYSIEEVKKTLYAVAVKLGVKHGK